MEENLNNQIEDTDQSHTVQLKLTKPTLMVASLVILVMAVVYFGVKQLNAPPNNFPLNEPVVIEAGTGAQAVTEQFEAEGVVKSRLLLYYALVLFNEPKDIKASAYVFDDKLSTWEVARRITEGDFDSDLVRFTHIEGERASQIADRADEILPNFNRSRFIAAATDLEGKLFPETYFIPGTYTDEDLLELLLNTYEEQISDLRAEMAVHPLSEDEIIILASIIEREANSPESMKLVSGILQNRLEINMALQADASIEYVLEKPLQELTPEDLEIDSPYNTYTNTGLPPTPIGNPGLNSIRAVLNPAETDYFYYITDDEGDFYYAETYQQHLSNIEKYLR